MVLCYAAGYAALGAGVMMVSRALARVTTSSTSSATLSALGVSPACSKTGWQRAAEMMPEPRRGDFQRYLLFRAFAAGEGWPRRRPSKQHSD
jgi:hypothetical protein